MARKKSPQTPPPPPTPPASVTPERFTRLFRLVRLLGAGPVSREHLTEQLALDVRGFYRDLELLRSIGIAVVLDKQGYSLGMDADRSLATLPFPDPHLTLGEVEQLARGRSRLHRKLQGLIAQWKA